MRGLLHRFLAGCLCMTIPVLSGRRSARPRSLWTGTPILNMAVNARAERLLGVQAESLVYFTYFITRQFDRDLSWALPWPRWARALLCYAVLAWACLRYDRFHFYCDRGLLPSPTPFQFDPAELPLLRALGKEVILWTYGADVRTRRQTQALGSFHCCTGCSTVGHSCLCDADAAARKWAQLQRLATAIFAMGDMIEYTPGSRNDLFFWPIDLEADDGKRYAPRFPPADASGPVRIVHAPNHRGVKGTQYLLAAVERLQTEGVAIDLRLVEQVPNEEALEIYRGADIIFDQCLIGFHGYFALEAMALGKPVMAFIRDPQRYLLAPDECPLVNTPADQVYAVLSDLVRDRAQLHRLGVQGRRYIEMHYTLEAFAARLQRAYDDLGIGRRGGS